MKWLLQRLGLLLGAFLASFAFFHVYQGHDAPGACEDLRVSQLRTLAGDPINPKHNEAWCTDHKLIGVTVLGEILAPTAKELPHSAWRCNCRFTDLGACEAGPQIEQRLQNNSPPPHPCDREPQPGVFWRSCTKPRHRGGPDACITAPLWGPMDWLAG